MVDGFDGAMTRGPGLRATIVCLGLSTIGLLIGGLQPLLYGTYVREGALTETSLGLLASMELAAIAVGSIIGVALLQRARTRPVVVLGIALILIGNLAPQSLSVFLTRNIAGLGGGLLVSLVAILIAQSRQVIRLAGTYLMLQALAQYLVVEAFATITRAHDSWSIQLAIAGVSGAALTLLPLVPHSLRPAHSAEVMSRPPDRRSLIALAAGGLFAGAGTGINAYLSVWLEQRGIAPADVTPMLAAYLAGQSAGALIAILWPTSHHGSQRFLIASAAFAATVSAAVLIGPLGWVGWLCIVLIGSLSMYATSSMSGYLVDVDPTRHALQLGASAQLIGAATIPTISGVMFASQGLDHVMLVCVAVVLASVLMVLWSLRAPASDPLRADDPPLPDVDPANPGCPSVL